MGRDFAIMKLLLIILIYWVNLHYSARVNNRQEAAKVDYYNPKYVSEAFAFTGRVKRNGPYTTNYTITNIVTVANNVTVRIQHNMKNSPIDLEITRRACDMFNIKWINDFITKYSDTDINSCPFVPRTYHVFDLEYHKDKILIPMPKGINEIRIIFEKADTREALLITSLTLHIF